MFKKGEEENMEKAEMLAKNVVKVHSSDNLTGEGEIKRRQTLDKFPKVYDKRNVSQSALDVPSVNAK